MAAIEKARDIALLKEAERTRPVGTRAPRVLVLVGIPGSGKSSFASVLSGLGLVVVCQDELGNRLRCERRIAESLLLGRDVVVDRCNFDESQRKHWVDYAQAAGASLGVIVFATPLQECMRRVQARTGHKTLQPGEESENVVIMMSNRFVFPKRNEGFGFCRIIREGNDLQRVYGELCVWFRRPQGQGQGQASAQVQGR